MGLRGKCLATSRGVERISPPSYLGVVRELADERLEESLGLVELVGGKRLMQGGQAACGSRTG